ncbi:MAG: ribonuclease HII [Candidatus Asgardarchaeia archaeon]
MKIAGIDEAGRGPVIGPMVIVGVVIEKSKLSLLSSLGVRDSKMLSSKKRESLYPELLKILDDYKIVVVQPSEIDARFSKNLTMNSLELEKMAKIIIELNPNVVYVDCPDIKPERFSEELRRIINKGIRIVAAHNADKKYPIVSAASIIAKVTRDRYIKEYMAQYGDIGSGYPSDPKTISFLKTYYKRHYKWPAIVRKTWSTVKVIETEIENMRRQSRLDSFI